MRIVVGEGSCGIAAGAERVRQALLAQELSGVEIGITGCIGMCFLEPIVDLYGDDGSLCRLARVQPEDAPKIAEDDDVTKNIGIRMVFRIARDVQYQNILGLNVLTI